MSKSASSTFGIFDQSVNPGPIKRKEAPPKTADQAVIDSLVKRSLLSSSSSMESNVDLLLKAMLRWMPQKFTVKSEETSSSRGLGFGIWDPIPNISGIFLKSQNHHE